MRVVEITQPGGPDVLRVATRPAPVPGPGEVLIAIEAAGVNRPDLMQREGHYPPPKGASDIPGLEVAGRITGLGPGEPRSASGRLWRAGDAVCALLAGGGYADECVVSGLQCLPIPTGLSMNEAAAIPETYFTVWTNVFDRARLAAGETILVHGGSSGIGTTAIQLALARGSNVIATAGSDEKCRRIEAFGGTKVPFAGTKVPAYTVPLAGTEVPAYTVKAINYRTEDFVERVKAFTNNRGVDVILDIVGGDYTARNIACLAREGRLVQIGLMGGANAEISLSPILLKRLTITGSTLRIRTPEEKGRIAQALERDVWPLLASGRVKPIIDRTFPLESASEAHRALESGATFGKIVLTR